MSVDPKQFFYIHALENAVEHENVPKAGAVLGLLMGKHPEFRSRAKEMSAILNEVLQEIDGMTPAERREKLAEMAPELLDQKKEKKTKERGLRDLKNVGKDGVVMRFAPNPSGPLHIGHARAAYLNDYYVRKYGGRYVLRIEDTDARRVQPENYGMILEDIEWLGLKISEIVYQSDRLDIYYTYCRKLLESGNAYVCTCDSAAFKLLKDSKKECPCRNQTVEENISLWEKMLDGTFPEGAATVRVKTGVDLPDPAMRDFSLFRIVETPHLRTDARVFPMMNFSVVIDDHLLGITHVIRGKDHIANTKRQGFIYDYLGWSQPEFYHYGRMSVGGLVLSTTAMKEGIRAGKYTGWDDIHLGTLRAIARRGIQADAVRNSMIDIGVGQTDIAFSWENLFAENKQVIDPVANRYFFVPNPVKCEIKKAPAVTAKAFLHPNDEARGYRMLDFKGTLYAPEEELADVPMVRFKDLFNVRIGDTNGERVFEYAGTSLEEARKEKSPIIQWLPESEKVKCILLTPEGKQEGLCEILVRDELDKVVQFERVGFARIDSVSDSGIVAYFAHR
ncbi:glutamyl-tRNA synthetase [Methanolacinia petrolearia DSM 11571]|uniref:Glutamate--tRNA ligase n=1 Tax=Methanolacinia petrolearia (strain DSM 11571 / OCM 486 / SEBR 4847) TaxID=679926 RepID=E1RIV0_METP4|nr:glutamate--tRNA ligase [Methanolacinia petrolearia]ADN35538.1 glutamyl-tRNA synthetase [Methanolacinia petrolearia DSM 11571]